MPSRGIHRTPRSANRRQLLSESETELSSAATVSEEQDSQLSESSSRYFQFPQYATPSSDSSNSQQEVAEDLNSITELYPITVREQAALAQFFAVYESNPSHAGLKTLALKCLHLGTLRDRSLPLDSLFPRKSDILAQKLQLPNEPLSDSQESEDGERSKSSKRNRRVRSSPRRDTPPPPHYYDRGERPASPRFDTPQPDRYYDRGERKLTSTRSPSPRRQRRGSALLANAGSTPYSTPRDSASAGHTPYGTPRQRSSSVSHTPHSAFKRNTEDAGHTPYVTPRARVSSAGHTPHLSPERSLKNAGHTPYATPTRRVLNFDEE